jgi:hypothetical protein
MVGFCKKLCCNLFECNFNDDWFDSMKEKVLDLDCFEENSPWSWPTGSLSKIQLISTKHNLKNSRHKSQQISSRAINFPFCTNFAMHKTTLSLIFDSMFITSCKKPFLFSLCGRCAWEIILPFVLNHFSK